MGRNELSRVRIFLVFLVMVALVLSAYFSFTSFTGYVVNESISKSANAGAAVLFLGGVVGAWFLLRRK